MFTFVSTYGAEVAERDKGWVCHYCNVKLVRAPKVNGHQQYNQATIDHIVPRSRGGATYDTNNMVLCCHQCNRERGVMDHTRFYARKALTRAIRRCRRLKIAP